MSGKVEERQEQGGYRPSPKVKPPKPPPSPKKQPSNQPPSKK